MKTQFTLPIHTFTQKVFKDTISKDDLRPAMQGILCDIKNNRLCTTNGHVLSWFELMPTDKHEELNLDELPSELILPLEALPKSLKKNESIELHFSNVTEETVHLTVFNATVETRIIKEYGTQVGSLLNKTINERFPRLDTVIPQTEDTDTVIGLDIKLLSSLVESFKSSGLKASYVKFNIKAKNKAVVLEPTGKDYDYSIHKALIMPIMID